MGEDDRVNESRAQQVGHRPMIPRPRNVVHHPHPGCASTPISCWRGPGQAGTMTSSLEHLGANITLWASIAPARKPQTANVGKAGVHALRARCQGCHHAARAD